jgi:hypothetical protein
VTFYGWLLLGSLGLLLIAGVGLTAARVCRRGQQLGLVEPLLTSPSYERGRGSLLDVSAFSMFHPESGGGNEAEGEAEMGDTADVNFAGSWSAFAPRQAMGRQRQLPAVGSRRGSWPNSGDTSDHVASALENRSPSLGSTAWPETRLDEAASREVARAALAPVQDEAEGEGHVLLAAELLTRDFLTSDGEDDIGGAGPIAVKEDTSSSGDNSDSSGTNDGDDLGRPSSGGRAASTRTTRNQSVMETVLEHEPEPPGGVVDLQSWRR